MNYLNITAEQLIEKADSLFPLRNPTPKEGLAEIMYTAGQRSVVEYLLSLLNEEHDDQ